MLEVIQHAKIECLADQLAAQIRNARLQNPELLLVPVPIVVAHPALIPLLKDCFARNWGVCAGVQFFLPSERLSQMAAGFGRTLLEPDQLASKLFNSLRNQLRHGQAVRPVPAKLRKDRGQLDVPLGALEQSHDLAIWKRSVRMAQNYFDYMLYRPDWILGWGQRVLEPRTPAAGAFSLETVFSDFESQGEQWRKLCLEANFLSRTELLNKLISPPDQALAHGESNLAHTRTWQDWIFFGFSHLAPSWLNAIQQYSVGASVYLYFANPCHEYWADVVKQKLLLKRFLQNAPAADDLLGADRSSTQPNAEDFVSASADLSTSAWAPLELSDAHALAIQHYEIGHPLLANLGEFGQAFFAELLQMSDQFSLADEPLLDQSTAMGTPNTVLQTLQQGIVRLDPLLRCEHAVEPGAGGDSSVVIEASGSRVEELLALKAFLGSALREDPHLKLDEIMVLCTELEAYQSLIPAVFGLPDVARTSAALETAGEHAIEPQLRRPVLGYTLVLEQPQTAPELLGFLLHVHQKRLDQQDILQFLQIPEVAINLHLDERDLSRVAQLLQRSNISFGLHFAHLRDVLELPETVSNAHASPADQHTWRVGLERLIFGYLHGDLEDNQATELYPIAGVTRSDLVLLLALSRALDLLSQCHHASNQARSVVGWCDWWQRLLDSWSVQAHSDGAVGGLPPSLEKIADSATAEKWEPCFAVFARLRELHSSPPQPADEQSGAQLADLVSAECFVAMFESLLGEKRTRLTRAQSGEVSAGLDGVRFASLLQARAQPFKIVAVLGLADGKFPSQKTIDPLNLMAREARPRNTDRQRALEDRYLFLELLMSARQKLWLSYVISDERGGSLSPSFLLDELVEQLKRHRGAVPLLDRIAAPPLNRSGLSSTQRTDGVESMGPVKPSPAAAVAHPVATEERSERVESIAQFQRFWRDPVQEFVRKNIAQPSANPQGGQLQSGLASLFEQERLTDPLSVNPEAIFRVEQRLLAAALAQGHAFEPGLLPAWLVSSGMLASGLLGEQASVDLSALHRQSFNRVLETALEVGITLADLQHLAKHSLRVALEWPSTRLSGTLSSVMVVEASEPGAIRYRMLKISRNAPSLQRQFLWQLEAAILLASELNRLVKSGNESDASGLAHQADLTFEWLILRTDIGLELQRFALDASQSKLWLQMLYESRVSAEASGRPLWFYPGLQEAICGDAGDYQNCLDAIKKRAYEFDLESMELACAHQDHAAEAGVSSFDSELLFLASDSPCFRALVDNTQKLQIDSLRQLSVSLAITPGEASMRLDAGTTDSAAHPAGSNP